MKKVFRSIINIPKEGKATIDLKELEHNYRAFLSSRVKPEDPSYVTLYSWIEAHFRDFGEVPDIHLLNERAESEGKEGVLACLREIVSQTPFIGSNYRAVLKDKAEEQNKDHFRGMLEKAWKIVSSGLKEGKKELKGIQQAVEYFSSEARKFRMGAVVKTESNIRSEQDAAEVREEYDSKKRDPLSSVGMYTFLEKIDDTVRGVKPGDLTLVAGFTGNGKSILCSNFAYQGVIQGLNGMFVCMEMSFAEMRRFAYVLHTSNPEWLDHPKFGKLAGKITYDKVKYGELNDLEEEFYHHVIEDFKSEDRGYGDLFMVQPSENLTPAGLEIMMYDFNARLAEQGKTLDFVVVDYVGLMTPDKDGRYGDYNADLNGIIKRLKNLAMTFDNGRRIRMISPFQINRQGWVEAEKNDGVYKLNALSSAHEAERSSDLVIGVFSTEEMRRTGVVKLCCMKYREGAQFPPFEAKMNFSTKYVTDFIQSKAAPSEAGINEIPTDAA